MSPKISPGPTKTSDPKRHGFGGDKKLRIAEHPKVQQCPLAQGPFPGGLPGEQPLGLCCPLGWLDKSQASQRVGVGKPQHPSLESCTERPPLQFHSNPPSCSHFHFHCFSFRTALAADCTHLSLPRALCMSARLCHLLEAVTPSMISLHNGTHILRLWARQARV